jgi:hypothetical protein
MTPVSLFDYDFQSMKKPSMLYQLQYLKDTTDFEDGQHCVNLNEIGKCRRYAFKHEVTTIVKVIIMILDVHVSVEEL